MSKIKKLTLAAMLMALQIVFARMLFIYTPGGLDRLSLAFIPSALIGLLLGPWWSLGTSVGADILGMLLNSAGLAFNPMFTIIAGIKGLLYGLLLYKKPLTIKRIVLTFVITTLVIDLGLSPLALMVYYGKAFSVVVLAKIPVQLLFCGVKIGAFIALRKPIEMLKQKMQQGK